MESAGSKRLAGEREQVKVRIESKAPTRIDLAGGTLDIWPLYLFHEGAVTVNCAITRYASCVVDTAPEKSRRIVLVSRDTRRQESFPSLDALRKARRYKLPLLAHLVRVFRPPAGFTLTTDSEAPAGAGIGGSSAMAVAICAALDRLTNAGLRREDWIHISRDVEAIVIRVPTGTQDHYPPAFGGAAAIVLAPGGERREALGCNLDELERRLVLCYTGKPRQSGINNWEVFMRHINGDRRVAQNLEKIARRCATGARGARTESMERTWPAGARGVGLPPPKPSNDLDSGHRPHYLLRTPKGCARRQSVRRGRWRVPYAGDRARSARAHRSGRYGGRRNAAAFSD